jgi:hypothetical protein
MIIADRNSNPLGYSFVPIMKIEELARQVEARLHLGAGRAEAEVSSFCASNKMSELIAHAFADTLMVTSLNNTQLIRIADLMDVPGICLAGGQEPSAELIEHARAAGKAVLSTSRSLEETGRLLEACLSGQGARKA